MTKVEHHGFAHLLLMVILFLLAVLIFGGWTEGPLTSALWIGIQIFGFWKGTHAGDLSNVGALGANLVSLLVVFIINLIVFYILSSILIFVFNLFGKKKAK